MEPVELVSEAAVLAGASWNSTVDFDLARLTAQVQSCADRSNVPLRVFAGKGAASGTFRVIVGIPVAEANPGDDPIPFSRNDLDDALARFKGLDDVRDELREFQPREPIEQAFVIPAQTGIEVQVAFGVPGTRGEARENKSRWFGQPSPRYDAEARGVLGCHAAVARHSPSLILLSDSSTENHREMVGASSTYATYYLSVFRLLDGHSWPEIEGLDALLEMLDADLSETGFRGVAPGSTLEHAMSSLGRPRYASVLDGAQQSVTYEAPLLHPRTGSNGDGKFSVLFVGYHGEPAKTVELRIEKYSAYGVDAEHYKAFVKRLKTWLKERWGKPEPERRGVWIYSLDGEGPVKQVMLLMGSSAGSFKLVLR